MMKRKYVISSLAIILTVCIGLGVRYSLFPNSEISTDSHDHSSALMASVPYTLEGDLFLLDTIIRGKVIETHYPIEENVALPERPVNAIQHTPAIVQVDEVLFGEVESETIKFMQPGSPSRNQGRYIYVNEGDEVILLLRESERLGYIQYNPNSGTWKIKDGVVTIDHVDYTLKSPIHELQGMKTDDFVKRVVDAAKNMKIPHYAHPESYPGYEVEKIK